MFSSLRYHLTMFIFKVEKRLRISTFFLFPFRLITRFYEIYKFKSIKKNNNIKAFSNYFLDISKIDKKSELTIISGGIAYNTFFEEELKNNYRIKNLILIDPSINSNNYALKRLDKFFFENKALSNKNENNVKIFLPPSIKEVNVSLDNTFETKNYEFVDTITISYLKKKYQLNKIDILKLDIEGVADIVILDCLNNKIFPKQICFELERPYAISRQYEFYKRTNKLVKELKKFYDIYFYTDQKKGIRLELLTVLKPNFF